MTEVPSLRAVVLEFLVRGDEGAEPVAFDPRGALALAKAIELLVASGEDPLAATLDLLKLVYVLESQEKSPAAARAIMEILGQNRALIGLLQALQGQVATGTRRFLGAAPEDRAPMVGAASPQGSLKLASMIQADLENSPERRRVARARPLSDTRPSETPASSGVKKRSSPERAARVRGPRRRTLADSSADGSTAHDASADVRDPPGPLASPGVADSEEP